MKFFALIFATCAALTTFVSSEVVVKCPTKKSSVKHAFEVRTEDFIRIKDDLLSCREKNSDSIIGYQFCCLSKGLKADQSIVHGLNSLTESDIKDEASYEQALNKIIDNLCEKIKEEYLSYSEDLDENGEYKSNGAGGIIFGLIIFVAIVGGLIWYFNKGNQANAQVTNTVPMPQNQIYMHPQPVYGQPPSPYYVPNAPSPYSAPSSASPYPQQYPMSPMQQPPRL